MTRSRGRTCGSTSGGCVPTLGTTVFLTTHYLDEADALCDRLFVIDHGVTVAVGTPDELKRRVSGDVVTLSVNGRNHGEAARSLLAASPVVREVTVADGALRLTVEHGEEALPVLLRTLDGAGITMSAISLSRPTLDDVFLTLTGRSLRDDSPGGAHGGDGEPELAGAALTGARHCGQGVADMSFISDTLFVFRRQQRLILRVPVFLIVGVLQPILYLALFGPLLTRLPAGTLSGGSGTGGTAEAYRFFVPGLLIQLALFGSTFVGFAIISEWRAGIIERYRVTPVSRVALLTGRVMRDVVTLVVQSTILILAGLAFGLRAPLGAVLLSYVYIVLVAIGLSSLSYATALRIKSEDAFAPLVNSVVLPLILLSGIMLPMTLGPGWLQGVARVSPFRYIIDAMREAYAGHYWDAVTVEGLCVAVGLAAALLWLGSRVFVSENS